jgi:histidyl-tRNA synthetase
MSFNNHKITKEVPEKKRKSPKEMVDLEHVDKAGEVALYYGFTPLKTPHLTPDDIHKAKNISEGEIVIDSDTHESGAIVRLEEKIALLRTYEDNALYTMPQPAMLYYHKPFTGDKRKTSLKETHRGLEIIGTDKSVAEAILIQTSLAILSEQGYENLRVEINSIGDKESLARFGREITAYYKKNMSELSLQCKQTMKKDVFSLLGCQDAKCKALALECPRSINFLSERSRTHFREVLEYIEILEIPYTINNTLVANRDYCSETIFEIRADNEEHPLAVGLRYDTLAKRLGNKKELSAVGVSFAFKKPEKQVLLKKGTVEKIMNPSLSYIQLGFEAKLKSLHLIEILRQAKIPLMHSLAKDKIGGQVVVAEKDRAETILIMGKKEAMEKSVIVRNATTRSQDTVLLTDLAEHLKKLKI